MDKLLSSIETRLKYICSNTENSFLISQCNIIRGKLDEIKDRKYNTLELIQSICNNIINNDIDKMRRVISDETNMVYKKMDELNNFISQIPELYFED